MSETWTKSILELLQSIGRLTGLNLVWKAADGSGEGGLGPEIYEHGNPFCRLVKATPDRLRRCVRDDTHQPPQAARTEPYEKTCHAGVTELVVPLWSESRYAGTIFLGPCRKPDGACPYAPAAAQFAALPSYDPEKLAAAGPVLAALAGHLLAAGARRKRQLQAESRRCPSLGRALEFMEQNQHRPLRAAEVAQACGLSVSRLLHLFPEKTGQTFAAHLLAGRLEQARRLLSGTDLRIIDIATDTGFCDQNHFAVVFKKQTGLTPTQFRRQARDQFRP